MKMDKELHDYCKAYDLDKARKLIEDDIDINISRHGITALSWAAYYNNTELVKILIEKGADLDLADTENHRPVCMAQQMGHNDAVELLVYHGADIDFELYQDLKKKSDFIEGLSQKDFDAEIVKKELDNNILEKLNGDELARVYDDRYFPSRSAVLVRNRYRRNIALHKAIIDNDVQTVKKILTRKNVDIKFYNIEDCIIGNALGYATLNFDDTDFKPNLVIIELLLRYGNFTPDDLGQTLTNVVQYNDLELIDFLIKNGADVNYFDGAEHTPLTMAIEYENIEIVKYLLDNGADYMREYHYQNDSDNEVFNAYNRAYMKDISLSEL